MPYMEFATAESLRRLESGETDVYDPATGSPEELLPRLRLLGETETVATLWYYSRAETPEEARFLYAGEPEDAWRIRLADLVGAASAADDRVRAAARAAGFAVEDDGAPNQSGTRLRGPAARLADFLEGQDLAYTDLSEDDADAIAAEARA